MARASSFIPLLTLLLLAVAAMPAAARVYKWVDEEGVTHYSQHPPPAGEATELELRATPSALTPEQAKERLESQRESLKASRDAREQRAKDGRQARASEERTAEACRQARQRLERLRSTPHINVPEGDGDRRLTEPERQTLIQEATQAVQDYCR
jgi:hypothetical protein